jgi:hypothetical protein
VLCDCRPPETCPPEHCSGPHIKAALILLADALHQEEEREVVLALIGQESPGIMIARPLRAAPYCSMIRHHKAFDCASTSG